MSKQRTKYEIHKFLRNISNRLCADCSDTLLSDDTTFAALTPKMFICKSCYIVHNRTLPKEFSSYKALTDEWTEDEVESMKQGHGNIERNMYWERYLPLSKIIAKPLPTSIDKEKEIWVKMKYLLKIFMVPQKNDFFMSFRTLSDIPSNLEDSDSTSTTILINSKQVDYLPSRAIDFYLVIGQGKLKFHLVDEFKSQDKNIFVPEDISFSPKILSSYPKSNEYSDMTIPDLVSHLVFPHGLSLSSKELPPLQFSIVLTDISRVKIYGSVLLVYELLEPQQVEEIITSINQNPKRKSHHPIVTTSASSTVYSPKALVLLSHYPFYNLFSITLKQFYRISLSSAPLPLERYIANVVNDIPLPPQGSTEVVASIADVVVQIRRPPPNQLPMVDFSYRPLFMLLSVDNILTIFRCLLCEYSLCFHSSSIALLTPIQEAVMSFLFPFVWQGVYIPLLEQSVIDIIDAPVPYVVGAQTSMLQNLPDIESRLQLSNTIFVDIDNDRLSFLISSPTTSNASPQSQKRNSKNIPQSTPESLEFNNTLNQRLASLPRYATNKLRAKLMEYGGVIHKSISTQYMDIISTADLAFPMNEHLIPIPSNAFLDRGTAKRKFSIAKQGSVNLSTTQTATKVFRNQTKPKSKSNRKHFTVCTIADYQHRPGSGTVIAKSSESTQNNKLILGEMESIFDSKNNSETSDGFDAGEIRGAFLRFFVACLQDYQELLASNTKLESLRSISKDSFLSSPLSQASLSSATNEASEGYIKEDEAFVRQLVRSQMFSHFESERRAQNGHIEYLFFDESIIDKKNRSLHVFSKKIPTPFLDDDRYTFNEIYTCPSPQTWAIDTKGKGYVYSQYPFINFDLVPPLLPKKILVQHTDRATFTPIAAAAVLNKHRKKFASGENVTSNEKTRPSSSTIDIDEWAVRHFRRYLRINTAITTFQIKLRFFIRHRHRQRRIRAALVIQKYIRRHFAIQQLRRLQQLKRLERQVLFIIRAQSFVRMIISRAKYIRIYQLTIYLQAYARMAAARRRYQRIRRIVVILQKLARGYLARVRQGKILARSIASYRVQLISLWQAEHSPLRHRASCWRVLGFSDIPVTTTNTKLSPRPKNMYLSLSLCKLEWKRVANVLELPMTQTDLSTHPRVMALATAIAATLRQISLSVRCQATISANIAAETQERLAVYQMLTTQSETIKNNFYEPFGLQTKKKRKRTLAAMLWMGGQTSMEVSRASAEVCLSLGIGKDVTIEKDGPSCVLIQEQPIEYMRRRVIASAVLEVARWRLSQP